MAKNIRPLHMPPAIKAPDDLKAFKAWLVWRYVQRPGEKKPRKVPYYVNGSTRNGKQGDERDMGQLAMIDEANEFYRQGMFDGIGFAALIEWGITCLDFDGCVVDGKILPEVEHLIAGTYSEISPSGTGVRAFMRGVLPSRKSLAKDGVFGFETFHESGFVTVTGNPTEICRLVGNENIIEDLTPEILKLYEERFGQGSSSSPVPGSTMDPLLTYSPKVGLTLAELRALVLQLDPDAGYLENSKNAISWLKVGMAIHHETDGSVDGLNLFDEWSKGSKEKYPGRHGIEAKWRSFDLSPGAATVTARSIVRHVNVKQAKEQGKHILDPKNPMSMANALLNAKFLTDGGTTLVRYRGSWYEHNGQCFVENEDSNIRAMVWHFLDRALKHGPRSTLVPMKPSKGLVDSTIDALKAAANLGACEMPSWRRGYTGPRAKDLVSLKNGLLHIPSRELIPHTPGFFTLNALPYEWDETAECPDWHRFLDQIWPDDIEAQETLQEIFGYLTTADTSQQKMFLIVGPRRSGKGTIGRVLTAMLSKDNVVSPQLSSLCGPFGLQPLIEKLVALVPDARVGGHMNSQGVVERLLMISGEDSISVERKHKDTWSGTMAARFFLLTNEMPSMGDASGALSGRFITLSLCESFYGKEDPTLSSKLLLELPGIFRWALEGKERLNRRGYFIQPQSGMEDAEELADMSSPIGVFVKECCELGVEYTATTNDLFNAWKVWCHADGRNFPGSKAGFVKLLKAAHPGLKRIQPRANGCANGTRERAYTGIRLINISDL
jgi:putative DNA primase/helicase